MKNSIKKISMSVIAGTLILGNISTVGAAPLNLASNCKNINVKSLYNYKYSNCSNKVVNPTVPTKPTAPNNNDTTVNQNNQAESQKPNTDNAQKPVTDSPTSSVEAEVLRLVNVERSKAGLAPLKMSTELSNVARMKSQDMADKNYFSHTSPTYGSPFDMMKQFGINYTAAGENIAKGYSSAEAVMNGWMNSPGHKANILSSKFGTLGVGYVNKNGTTYWTQMFTN